MYFKTDFLSNFNFPSKKIYPHNSYDTEYRTRTDEFGKCSCARKEWNGARYSTKIAKVSHLERKNIKQCFHSTFSSACFYEEFGSVDTAIGQELGKNSICYV